MRVAVLRSTLHGRSFADCLVSRVTQGAFLQESVLYPRFCRPVFQNHWGLRGLLGAPLRRVSPVGVSQHDPPALLRCIQCAVLVFKLLKDSECCTCRYYRWMSDLSTGVPLSCSLAPQLASVEGPCFPAV
ncbi:hypothetical protein NDU88_007793 [Pleurodeles waltl]|uniref:Uncharacterized protein n=1 Tax=Pleurodeles waltl TaxID=8319 RepID=A0AAV7PSF9_PLEWA|nr:hypothetical protein NDU88_007793 [Pleurodeles waltl]